MTAVPQSKEIKVPAPRQLPSGSWFIRMTIKGEEHYITETTEAMCRAKAIALKAGLIKSEEKASSCTLGAAMEQYLADKDAVLSPATIAGYKSIKRTRFKNYINKPINSINYQRMVNDELKLGKSAKTVMNAWSFAQSAVEYKTGMKLQVSLAAPVKREHLFLDYEQIKVFLKAVNGEPCELAALLALHSLRFSEIKALTLKNSADLKQGIIHVRGAMVYDEYHQLVLKEANKTEKSRRDLPIMIPRLRELLEAVEDKEAFLVPSSEITVYKQINRICKKAGLPEIGIHGLRHSFASLCYHLDVPEKICMKLGGWSRPDTVHEIYTHLADKDIALSAQKLMDFFKNCNEFATTPETN